MNDCQATPLNIEKLHSSVWRLLFFCPLQFSTIHMPNSGNTGPDFFYNLKILLASPHNRKSILMTGFATCSSLVDCIVQCHPRWHNIFSFQLCPPRKCRTTVYKAPLFQTPSFNSLHPVHSFFLSCRLCTATLSSGAEARLHTPTYQTAKSIP